SVNMKYSLLFLVALLFNQCASSQLYSTQSKKAEKLFSQALEVANGKRNPETNRPDFETVIQLSEKAIAKDPNFWEPHLLCGETYESMGEFEKAIQCYEAAIAINPRHYTTGSTYFFLGNLQNAIGNYEHSTQSLDIFIGHQSANPHLKQQAQNIIQKNIFATNALNNPLPFDPVNCGPGINTSQPEYFPTITVDGKTILFTRRVKDNRIKMQFKEQEDFFVSQLNNEQWSEAISMPANVNTVNNEGAPTISADGRTLVFVGCPDITGAYYGENRYGRGSCDLFITKRLGKRWTTPKNLPGEINSSHWESQPSLSSDGKTMYFIRENRSRNASKNSDIYVSKKDDKGNWGRPQRLSNQINTPYPEESVLIHPDGRTLYFASHGHLGMGGSDLFMSRMDENGNWSKPENLGYPINTKYDENSLMVAPDGEIAFFASNREGGFGNLDIYYFEMPDKMKPVKTLYFDGLVFDKYDRSPIPGKFQLIDLSNGKEVVYSEADPITGEFMVALPIEREYALNVSYAGYALFTQNFDMSNPKNLNAIHMDVPLIPISAPVANGIPLANVFFDLNKATLRKKSFVELNQLVEFMQSNIQIRIEIGGHTDSRGSDNIALSRNRAKAVYDYLISKGISANRLSYKGYGSSKPVNSDEKIANLDTEEKKEAAHQENRRTEYKILTE
ncbi:OmpA family protein, partial [Crocinitomicaceae bacterium]|nr:OmpA family protein [Crocinitomicaceae bacterium]